MKPLQSVAMGYVFIALYARFNGYDAYADPVGWVLVLLGVRRLPATTPFRFAMLYAGAVAALVSVPLWFPAVHEALGDLDPSVAWAVDLPSFAFTALLCHGLVQTGQDAGDPRAATRFGLVRTLVVVVAVLPVLVFGAGVSSLADVSGLAAQLVYLVLIWQLFSFSGRPWAGAPADDRPREGRSHS